MRSALAAGLLFFALTGTAMAEPSFDVTVTVDASKPAGPLRPIWRFFGADEPNYATAPNGVKLLAELGNIGPGPTFFRAHNLLTTGDGTPALKWGSTNAYTETPDGRPVYDWTILDQIFDAYRDAKITPYVQIGFMPEALSSKPRPYRHHWSPADEYATIFTGWAYPPTDYDKWGELVFQWATHCANRYGADAVKSWYWETWNEPNIGYWQGTPTEFYRLHDVAVAAVRRAIPEAKVGGPDVAGSGGDFSRGFFEHCLRGTNAATGAVGTPLDFVSFHAKGHPTFVDGHVRMGMAEQLRTVDEGFSIIAGFPELKGKPVVIGECDPEGCAACQGPALGYRNGTVYSSYTAASFARLQTLADRRGINLTGALTWAFEFEGQPFFAGQRALATNGVDLPVLNAFRLFGMMAPARVQTASTAEVPLDELLKSGVRATPDVGAMASAADGRVTVLLWHYHDDDVPGPAASVAVNLAGLPAGPLSATEYRIDADHADAFAAWQKMGSPQPPTAEQARQLEKAAELRPSPPTPLKLAGGAATVHLTLPRQGVALLVIAKP